MDKRPKQKNHVFERESELLMHAETVSTRMPQIHKEDLAAEYAVLLEHYARLLGDAKLVTSVSDRLQNKLNNANDELNEANERITAQNDKLRKAIIMLKEARAGKRATTIVLLLALFLFFISEAFIEPKIEQVVADWYVGLAIKAIITVMLKPIESIVEKYLYQKSVMAGVEI
jgi:hypothetical protein